MGSALLSCCGSRDLDSLLFAAGDTEGRRGTGLRSSRCCLASRACGERGDMASAIEAAELSRLTDIGRVSSWTGGEMIAQRSQQHTRSVTENRERVANEAGRSEGWSPAPESS